MSQEDGDRIFKTQLWLNSSKEAVSLRKKIRAFVGTQNATIPFCVVEGTQEPILFGFKAHFINKFTGKVVKKLKPWETGKFRPVKKYIKHPDTRMILVGIEWK